MRLISFNFLIAVLICFLIHNAFSSKCQGLATAALTDTIPLDPAVRKGHLANGFTYYIAYSKTPPAKVVMQLTVNAGTVLQDTDQVEHAHVLEHMGFGATKHFRSIFGYLDSIGLRRGADVNGATAADETNYWAVFPADGGEVQSKHLLVMLDFARGIIINPSSVDRERGVVIRETLGVGQMSESSEQFVDQYSKQIFRHSRYAENYRTRDERVAALRALNVKALSRFYDDWYRPNLQGLFIVGDIDVDKVERQVHAMFKDLQNPVPGRPRPTFGVPLTNEGGFMSLASANITNIEVRLSLKRKHRTCYIVGDFKTRLEERLYEEMMRVRFSKISEKYEQVYVSANHYDEKGYYPDLDVLNTRIVLRSNDLKQGLQIVTREFERVILYGFSRDELEQAKRSCLKNDEDLPSSSSIALISQYSRNFLTRGAAPEVGFATDLKHDLLERITVDEVNKRANELLQNLNRDIFILSPSKYADSLPDEATVLLWMSEVKKEAIKPYEQPADFDDSRFLNRIAINKASSLVKSRRYIHDVDVTELALQNGVRVVIKPLKKKSDMNDSEMKIYAFNCKGASSYPIEEYYSARYAAEIVENSGLGGLSKDELEKFFLKRELQGAPFMGFSKTAFSGKSKVENVEMLLQLMCEYYRNPMSDQEAFMNWKKGKERMLAFRMNDPQVTFENMMDSIRGLNAERRFRTRRPLDYVNRDVAFRIYKEQFAASDDMVVIIVGCFDVDKIVKLSSQYIGALPAKKAEGRVTRKVNSTEANDCRGLVHKMYLGKDSLKADVRMILDGIHKFSVRNKIYLEALEFLLQDVLTHRLRDIAGGVYSVYVSALYSHRASGRYVVEVFFSCSPRDVDGLVLAVTEEFEKLIRDGVNQSFLEGLKSKGKASLPDLTTGLNFWTNYLSAQYQVDANPSEVIIKANFWDKIRRKELQKAIKKFVRIKCFNRFIFMPS
jgi:zinc protease